ncbi:hypothetical protein [Cryptosporangium sp. NPDC051539]
MGAALVRGRVVGPDPSAFLFLAAAAGLGPVVLLTVSTLAVRHQARV